MIFNFLSLGKNITYNMLNKNIFERTFYLIIFSKYNLQLTTNKKKYTRFAFMKFRKVKSIFTLVKMYHVCFMKSKLRIYEIHKQRYQIYEKKFQRHWFVKTFSKEILNKKIGNTNEATFFNQSFCLRIVCNNRCMGKSFPLCFLSHPTIFRNHF